MRFLLLLLILIFIGCHSSKKTIDLYNGKDFTGWHIDVPDMDTTDVESPFIAKENSIITMGNPRGHLITDAEHSNYRLEVTYKFLGEPGNCGVLLHASTPRSLYDMFPKSIEAQMMHENAGDFWVIVEDITVDNMVERRGPKEEWGNTKGMKRRILNLTDGSENPLGEWNTMVVECFQDKIKVWVNDDLVNYGYDCSVTKGQIALQSEGAAVEFKDVKLTPIKKLSD
ncbi:3-keto-disaccharide hydrolase [Portibacter lacus]|uniref:3-keto-alpha-glucoside-1,2-lyase/3-keto-2-hydroxy-glucal hydratase domain-containing protein n=1 Tax=Portibacter lacus TaxID=1099794 RepID=A0AA37SLK6_9BACT|nr:DUF1080 domain-containing protein [Portibacter lacus]GLR15502.1 hypothetical protein GCM10007940_01170 [Portibacter lacus]